MLRVALVLALLVSVPAVGLVGTVVPGEPDGIPTGGSPGEEPACNESSTSTPASAAESVTPGEDTIAPGSLPSNATDSGGPRIVAAYPNPNAYGDTGEFVVLSFPNRTDLAGWSLADDEERVPLPDETVTGQVAVTADVGPVRNLTDLRVLAVDGPRVANAGEHLRLRRGNATVDAVTYRDAPEGEVRLWTGAGRHRRWRPLGGTDRPVVHTGGGPARAFVLPDAPGVPVETLRGADRRILLAGYTFTSGAATDALVAAARHDVEVQVLVDGAPVGGFPREMARALDRLVRAGAHVAVLGGSRARYAFHHAKYAVVDDRALVLTENWKPAGTGGRSSRGWGVLLDDPAAARALASTFHADAGWHDARDWQRVRRDRTFEAGGTANGSYPPRFDPRRVCVERAAVLAAPDNAEPAVVARIDAAEESVLVLQASIGGRDGPFLRAVRRAARRGVRVQILLSGAWYVREENSELVEWLDRRADAQGLPLAARVADPRGRYGKIHAKGVVIDRERVLLGSMNWNTHSARENREIVVALEGEAVAGYYARVFRADWRGGAWRLPVGFAVAVVLAIVGAVASARHFRTA